MTTKTKTKKTAPAFAQASDGAVTLPKFDIESYKREMAHLNSCIEKGEGFILKGKVMVSKAYVDLGNACQRIKAAWTECGKPMSMAEVQKELGISAADWSRYSRLAQWVDDNAEKLSDMEPAARAEAIMAQLAELRSMNKAKTDERKAKAEAEEGEGDEPEASNDMVDEQIEGFADELAAEIIDGIDEVDEDKQHKWLLKKLISFAKDARKL